MDANFTFDQWKESKATLVFEHPTYGKFSFFADNEKYKFAVEHQEIAFSPKEVMRIFLASDMGYFDDKIIHKIVAAKKFFPTANVLDTVGPEGRVNYKLKVDDAAMGLTDKQQRSLERELKDMEKMWVGVAGGIEDGGGGKEEKGTISERIRKLYPDLVNTTEEPIID